MLSDIQARLGAMVRATWAADVGVWGGRVKLYRDYMEGDHRAKMTPEMRAMLRISADADEQFNDNYCDLVVNEMADRLVVTSIDADEDAGTDWMAGLLADNRFDALQMNVHRATIRDGDTFVMASYDEATGMVKWVHEPAYDGDSGMIPVYNRTRTELVAAVKIWWEADATGTDVERVNVYYPDRVEKLVTVTREVDGKQVTSLEDVALGEGENRDLKDREGRALGVPVFHHKNRAETHRDLGTSELKKMVPLQDALNRTLYSMVAAAENTGFAMLKAWGFEAPQNLSPGMVINIGKDGLTTDDVFGIERLPGGDIVPFVSQGQFLIEQIGATTMTPLPGQMGGDNASGEAIKQREVGLLGKVRGFQVAGGNVWEDIAAYSHKLETAFGLKQPPAVKRWNTQWKDAQIRNDGEVVDNALKVKDAVSDETFLRLIGPVFGFDDAAIETIMEKRAAEMQAKMAALGGRVAGFSQFAANGAGLS